MMIIAEAGVNHLGNLHLAKKLVDEAKWAGADIIKFQTYFKTVTNPLLIQKEIDELEDMKFSKDEWIELKEYCDDKNIIFLSTPENDEFDTIDFLDKLVPIFKVASPSLTNKKFIKHIANKNKPMLISTGSIKNENRMATNEEIEKTLSWIPKSDATLLHCISEYPCINPHYRRIQELKKFGYPVGLSDHNKNIYVPKDISIIEKHFMLPNIDCPDKDISLIPQKFRQMVEWLKYL